MTDYTRFTKLEAEEIKAKKVEGALPSVTSADVGKALTVEAKIIDDKTIVPEQTVDVDEDLIYYIPDYDATPIVEGATVKVSIENVTEFVGTATMSYNEDESPRGYYVLDVADPNEEEPTWVLSYLFTGYDEYGEPTGVPFMGIEYVGLDEAPASITVSASTVHTEYEWSAITPAPSGGGHDIEIACNANPASATADDLTIISGSIEAVEAKFVNGQIPTGKLAFFYEIDGDAECVICDLGRVDNHYNVLRFYSDEALTSTKKICDVGFDSSYAITYLNLI